MTLKDLLTVMTIRDDKLHLSTIDKYNIVSDLLYICEYFKYADNEIDSISFRDDGMYIVIKEEKEGGENE